MAQPPLSTTTDKRYKWDKHSLPVDDDFEQRYKAAERAYGAGDYEEASRIAGALLNQLETTAKDPDAQTAAQGWRAFVGLLLANVELYGLNHAETAAGLYQLVLDNQPHETLAELAEQGLERARAIPDEPAPSQRRTPVPTESGTNLLRDPFLNDQELSSSFSTATHHQSTAMPWVEQLPNAPATQTPSPEPTIQAEPQPTPTFTPIPTATQAPQQEPSPPVEPQPTAEPTPSPQPDPMDLLAGSLLRVQVQRPAQKATAVESHTESHGTSWLQRLLPDQQRRSNR